MSDSVRPCGLYPSRLLCVWDTPGKNTAVGCHALLQGIFPTQGTDIFNSQEKVKQNKAKQKPISTEDKNKQRFLTSISNFNIPGVFYKLMLNATLEAVWVHVGVQASTHTGMQACVYTHTHTHTQRHAYIWRTFTRTNIHSTRTGDVMR